MIAIDTIPRGGGGGVGGGSGGGGVPEPATVKITLFEYWPTAPLSFSTTTTSAPGLATSSEKTRALSVVLPYAIVSSGSPFTSTIASELKFAPLTVKAKLDDPAATEAGEIV